MLQQQSDIEPTTPQTELAGLAGLRAVLLTPRGAPAGSKTVDAGGKEVWGCPGQPVPHAQLAPAPWGCAGSQRWLGGDGSGVVIVSYCSFLQ